MVVWDALMLADRGGRASVPHQQPYPTMNLSPSIESAQRSALEISELEDRV